MRARPGSLASKLASSQNVQLPKELKITSSKITPKQSSSQTNDKSSGQRTEEPTVSRESEPVAAESAAPTAEAPQLDIPKTEAIDLSRRSPSSTQKSPSPQPTKSYFSGTDAALFGGRTWTPTKGTTNKQRESRAKRTDRPSNNNNNNRPARAASPRSTSARPSSTSASGPRTRSKSLTPVPARKRLTRMEFYEIEPDVSLEDIEEVPQVLTQQYIQMMEGPEPGENHDEWMVSLITEQPPPAHPALTTPDVSISPSLNDVFGTRDEKTGLPAHISAQPHIVDPKWVLRKYGGDYSNHIPYRSAVTAGRVRKVADLVMGRKPEIEITRKRILASIVKAGTRADRAQV